LVLYLVFLTQFNDVMQYTWGKLFGRHKIIPKVSPNKTWQGFGGGVLTTAVLAALLGPWLTPLSIPQAILAGLIIGAGGFVGDVIISALKRDIGVKDSGSLLPGHGGLLDRLDSLLYTAPLFFHFVYYLHY
ncbi:MAG: phosphatidate cytidylyltransferase, partial [Gammaproteobacteria bacterium]